MQQFWIAYLSNFISLFENDTLSFNLIMDQNTRVEYILFIENKISVPIVLFTLIVFLVKKCTKS